MNSSRSLDINLAQWTFKNLRTSCGLAFFASGEVCVVTSTERPVPLVLCLQRWRPAWGLGNGKETCIECFSGCFCDVFLIYSTVYLGLLVDQCSVLGCLFLLFVLNAGDLFCSVFALPLRSLQSFLCYGCAFGPLAF